MNPTEKRQLMNAANPLGVMLGGVYALLTLASGFVAFFLSGQQQSLVSSAIHAGVGFGLILMAARAGYVAGWEAGSKANKTKSVD